MNHQQAAFRRKIVYLAAMVALLLPLSLLGLPRAADAPRTSWRVLANLRDQHQLAQSSLGDIDPKSETLKFACFGFRGVGAMLLWNQAHEDKKKQRWTALKDDLDRLAEIQPNFVNVWRHQGWNLSYNVSAEWDDYRKRYEYVLQGISYLGRGQHMNRRETRLIWDEGWFTAHKIGRSDEYRQFRRLFQQRIWFADPEKPKDVGYRCPPAFQDTLTPDNWLCAKEKFLEALDLAENHDVPLRGMSEDIYRSEPAKCQMGYARAVVEEGMFGDAARFAWKTAGEDWEKLGNRPFLVGGAQLTMNDYDALRAELKDLVEQLDDLSGVDEAGQKVTGASVRAKLREERREDWKKRQDPRAQAVLDKPEKDRTAAERQQATALEGQLTVPHADVGRKLPESMRGQAASLVARISEKETLASAIESKRRVLNYAFWKARCQASASEDWMDAEELLYQVRQARQADPGGEKTIGLYEKAFAKWRVVLDRYPLLADDGTVGDLLVEEIRGYRKAVGENFDRDKFILKDVMDARPSDFPTEAKPVSPKDPGAPKKDATKKDDATQKDDATKKDTVPPKPKEEAKQRDGAQK